MDVKVSGGGFYKTYTGPAECVGAPMNPVPQMGYGTLSATTDYPNNTLGGPTGIERQTTQLHSHLDMLNEQIRLLVQQLEPLAVKGLESANKIPTPIQPATSKIGDVIFNATLKIIEFTDIVGSLRNALDV